MQAVMGKMMANLKLKVNKWKLLKVRICVWGLSFLFLNIFQKL